MKILILGATGKTGKQLVEQALEQNHEVTVLVRDPSRLGVSGNGLKVITGNVLDRDVLTNAIRGNDAVISALGVGESFKSGNLISNAVNVLIPAMNEAGVKRLIFLSAFGVGKTYYQSSLIAKIFFKTLLKDVYADKTIADEQLRHSNLDWTLVFPGKLNDGKRTGKYKVGENLEMKGFATVSRADVAAFILQQLTDTTYLRKEPVIL